MKKITEISGKTIPLQMDDVDTDLIIPAQYLTAVSKEGYGKNVFRRLRDADPAFVFNQRKFEGYKILISRCNFGCGSSREHAVWALQESGIDAIIAISFADIFFSNSGKNGLVLIQLAEPIVTHMINQSKTGNYFLTIDIENQKITSSNNEVFDFFLDPYNKHCFVNGQDDLDYLLAHESEIENFRKEERSKRFVLELP